MKKIVEVTNFLSKSDCQEFIDFMEDHLDSFLVFDSKRQRHIAKFGYDDDTPDIANMSLDSLKEVKDSFVMISEHVKQIIKDEYSEPNLYLTSLFLSKHIDGGVVAQHNDTIPGVNEQLKYTAMIYLNREPGDTSKLVFPVATKSFKPDAGDLIIFESGGEYNQHYVEGINKDRYTLPIWYTTDRKFELS